MTFGSTFGRVFSPTFQPNSQAAVASSWWLAGGIAAANCVAAYRFRGAISKVDSLLNLTGDSDYDGVLYNTGGWNATDGLILGNNVGNAYVRTGILVQKGWSIVAQLGTCTKGWTEFGVQETGGIRKTANLCFNNGNKILWVIGGGLYGTDTSAATSGNLAIIGNKGYLNGVLDGTGTDNYDATIDLQIGGFNNNGSADGQSMYCQSKNYAFAVYNTLITTTQLSALITAMAAL